MAVMILSRDVARYAKEKCQISASDIHPGCDINSLLDDSVQLNNYGTLELNQFKLDGNFNKMNRPHKDFGFISNSISDENGNLNENCNIIFEFSEPQTASGLTLWFDIFNDEYCNDLSVFWYNESDEIISEIESHIIDKNNVYIENTVENFSKIMLEFHSVNKPNRHLKLTRIDFGESYILNGKLIEEVEVLEEIDLSRCSMPANRLEFIVNSMDEYKFRKGMQIDVYNDEFYVGMFFVDDVKQLDEFSNKITCYDASLIKFEKSDITSDDVYEAIMNITEPEVFLKKLIGKNNIETIIENVDLNSEVFNNPTKGNLRSYMTMVQLDTWGFVDCSRSNKIRFIGENDEIKEIDGNRIFKNSIQLKDKKTYNGIKYSLIALNNFTKFGGRTTNNSDYGSDFDISLTQKKVDELKNNAQFLEYTNLTGAYPEFLHGYYEVSGASTSRKVQVELNFVDSGIGWFLWKLPTSFNLENLDKDNKIIYLNLYAEKDYSSKTVTKTNSTSEYAEIVDINIPFNYKMIDIDKAVQNIYDYYVTNGDFRVLTLDMVIEDEKCGDKIKINYGNEETVGIIQSVKLNLGTNKNIGTVEVVC